MPPLAFATGAPAAAAIATGAGTTSTTFAGATIAIATGIIANTAAVSTGAFATSAAIFVGVTALPSPWGGQTPDHPLDAISTAASTVTRAAPPRAPHLLPLNTTH